MKQFKGQFILALMAWVTISVYPVVSFASAISDTHHCAHSINQHSYQIKQAAKSQMAIAQKGTHCDHCKTLSKCSHCVVSLPSVTDEKTSLSCVVTAQLNYKLSDYTARQKLKAFVTPLFKPPI